MSKIDPREERIAKICLEINKSSFGGDEHNAVMWLGSRDAIQMARFSSGCRQLDMALGGGGWPKGRQIEIFGPESGGKTTLCYHAVAQHQMSFPDEDAALIDSEYAFDEAYAKAIGVDTRLLIVHQPDSGEQALNVANMLIERGVGIIIVDSVAALIPREEMLGEGIGEGGGLGSQARMMSQALRRINTEAGKRGATIFWTNQIREKIGVMFGDPTTTPAGRALKHYASIRVNVKRIGSIKEKVDGEDVVISAKTKADVKKNKTAPPFRSAEFCITFGIGIDRVASVFDQGVALKVIEKRGSWLSFGGEQLGQGRLNVINVLRENKALVDQIDDMIVKAIDDGKKPEAPVSAKPKVGKNRTPKAEEGDEDSMMGAGEDGEVEVTDV